MTLLLYSLRNAGRFINTINSKEAFGHRVMAIGFATEWPPRSPNLAPCDFYLWGHLKNQVYKTPPASLQILRERIENAFMETKDNPQVIRKAVLAVRHRANRRVERNGGHVEDY